MNVIKEIKSINSKLDFIIEQIGRENMVDTTSLEKELSRANSLVLRSKAFINSLLLKIQQHESTIANTTNQILTSSNVVSSVTTGLSSTLSDFETFLNTISNSVSNSTSTFSGDPDGMHSLAHPLFYPHVGLGFAPNTTANSVSVLANSATVLANNESVVANSVNVVANTSENTTSNVSVSNTVANSVNVVANTVENVTTNVANTTANTEPVVIHTATQTITQHFDPRNLHNSGIKIGPLV